MSTLVAQTISNGVVSTSSANVIQGSAKAWVNFNSSSGSSCVIRASYNVSSVTYSSTGQYIVNFTNALTDANYSIVGMAGFNDTSGAAGNMTTNIARLSNALTSSAAKISTSSSSGATFFDQLYVCISVFR
jgi:hypothetical protein